jgi:uncharacterized protein
VILVQWLELKASDGGILTRIPATILLPSVSTVAQALNAIGLYATENTLLHDGDRLEILDDLKFDPMESRRRRARHKVKTKREKELAKYERRSRKQAKTST